MSTQPDRPSKFYGSQQRVDFQKNLLDSSIWACCLNCEHWTKKVEAPRCVKYACVPPLEVITIGCPSWEVAVPF